MGPRCPDALLPKVAGFDNPPTQAVRADSVLYDMGSGFGRFVSFLREHTNSSRVVGIEVNSCRARQAARLSSISRLELRRGDVRQLGFADATHVFITAQCWGEQLLRAVFGRLAQRAPRLRCVVQFGSLPHAHDLAAIFGRWPQQ